MTHTPSPKRPYLLRAYYDWLVDNDFTPYLVVDANYYGTNVPVEYVKDGQIVLNLSAGATGNLQLTMILFSLMHVSRVWLVSYIFRWAQL